MAFAWEKVDPENAVDRLPQPYRMINKVVLDLLEAVGDEITAITMRKHSESSECGLRVARSTACVHVGSRISCAFMEQRGTARLVFGTSQGAILLVDATSQEVIAQEYSAFECNEPITCVAICSDATHQALPPAPGIDPAPAFQPRVKVLAAGVSTPRIHIYDIVQQQFGVALKPTCVINVPKPPTPKPDDEEDERPVIEQLHTKGTNGAIWVFALLCDRTVCAYLCPLGKSALALGEVESVIDKAIVEGDEEAEEDGQTAAPQPFLSCTQVHTPIYSFQLASLSPMPSLAEPELETLTLSFFSPRPEGGPQLGIAIATGLEPTFAFVSSSESNVVVAYSFRSPGPMSLRPGEQDAQALLQMLAPAPGELPSPGTPQTLAPKRTWSLPAKSTAVAVSPNGAIYAIGGAQGSLALVNTANGPSLRTMLPGHYGAVTALAFYRAEYLISTSIDGWVHHYCMRTDALLARYLCSPPTAPASVVGLAVSQTTPLAISLDSAGGLRLIDVKRGRKIAQITCHEEPERPILHRSGTRRKSVGRDATTIEASGAKPKLPNPTSEAPRLLLSHAKGFCVLCMAMGDAGDAEDGEEMSSDRSWLVFFEQASVIKRLFPTLATKGDDAHLAKMYEALSQDELAKLQPKGQPSVMDKAVLLSLKQPPPMKGLGLTSSTRVPPRPRSSGGKVSTKSQLRAPSGGTLKLSAENLRKYAMQSQQLASLKKLSSSMASGGFAASGADSSGLLMQKDVGLHAVPLNWQVQVQKEIKDFVAGKVTRRAQVERGLEQIRKEIGDS